MLYLRPFWRVMTRFWRKMPRRLPSVEEDKETAEAELAEARKSHQRIMDARIKVHGEKAEPSEEEKAAKSKCDMKENHLYNLNLTIKGLKKKQVFDEAHKKSAESELQRTTETIERLEKKIKRETEEAAKAAPELPEPDPVELSAAIQAVNDAGKVLETVQAELLSAYGNYSKTACIPLCVGHTRDQDEVARVMEAVNIAREKLKAALADYSGAKKRLDAVRKGYAIKAA